MAIQKETLKTRVKKLANDLFIESLEAENMHYDVYNPSTYTLGYIAGLREASDKLQIILAENL